MAAAFASAVNEVVVEHFRALTQEHQLTSRIAQKLEDRLNGFRLGDAILHVIAQELPDKGRGALERKVGADMLVSIELEGQFSKGFLVQAKWSGKAVPEQYIRQCEDMLKRSPASYGWEFGRNGTRVFKASSVVKNAGLHPPFDFGRGIEAMMKKFLICKEGDRKLGVKHGPYMRDGVTTLMKEWGIPSAVVLTIEK